jgi:hypothetical protein
MRAEFPVEQLASHAGHPFQQGFARQASRLIPPTEAHDLQTVPAGLLIQARDEDALAGPVAILRDIYGSLLHLAPPRPRLLWLEGRWCEPIMMVRARLRHIYLEGVRRDLLARGALMLEEDDQPDGMVLRAKAPLERLLGYGPEFSALTGASCDYWMWLDCYRPMEVPPGGLAA